MAELKFAVTEEGKVIAVFLRLLDAEEFLSHLQYGTGNKFYEIVID